MGNSAAPAQKDVSYSNAPLYVVYGHPEDENSKKVVELLEEKELHHCKIGVNLINEALSSVPEFLHRNPRVPQVFACPSAEMLADEAGSTPGALGATAHGAVSKKMCKYIGGLSQLTKIVGEAEPTEVIYKTFDLPSSSQETGLTVAGGNPAEGTGVGGLSASNPKL